ncbi:MAG: GNAT family N-acetyltransferase [Saprospiraceae bacterium]|nr:GNAT family N-acetyltransferase [Bacteroidia bacterium]NNL93066.1 GNAT family N-acetyltransferase [Saprospiraceae bacterium]
MNTYIFKSQRLGFRNWKDSDIEALHEINSDKKVMEFFPRIKTKEESSNFMKRMQNQFETRGYCYFATDLLEENKMIGFVGLAYQTYEAPFTPAVDIGWRLNKNYWGKGYATEGAKACLDFAFNALNINEVISLASAINIPSINVMKKINMEYQYDFEHALLVEYPKISKCSLYKITK